MEILTNMYNGKIFPTKLRKIVAITGSILLLVIVILAVLNVVSSTILDLCIAVVVIVFAFLLPQLIKKHEQNKQINKLKILRKSVQ
jgi:uncharacterized membrane protein